MFFVEQICRVCRAELIWHRAREANGNELLVCSDCLVEIIDAGGEVIMDDQSGS